MYNDKQVFIFEFVNSFLAMFYSAFIARSVAGESELDTVIMTIILYDVCSLFDFIIITIFYYDYYSLIIYHNLLFILILPCVFCRHRRYVSCALGPHE